MERVSAHLGENASNVVCSSPLAENQQGSFPRLLCPPGTCQQQRCNYQSPFRPKHRFNEGWTGHRSEDETPIPPKPTKKRTLFQSSALNEKALDARPIHPRTLPPIPPDRSAAPQDVSQQALSPHSVPPPPLSTLPETRLPGFQDILHPISGGKISVSGRQHEGEGTDSPRTAPLAAMSQLSEPPLPSTSVRKYLPSGVTLPPNAPALMNIQLHPQSFSTTPFSAAGPASPKAQITFGSSTSESGTGWGTDQMITLDTENGPIQVPVDVQVASKVAKEKRKRNATASQRFCQRRKENEREYAQNIAKLEQQIKQLEEEKEHYRKETDYFREIAVRGQAHLLPRPISPGRRASLSGPG